MTTVLGIDAGGTGTRAVVVRDGTVEQLPTGPPMNLLLHADAVDRLTALVRGSGAGLVGIGLPGLRGDRQAAALADRLSAATGARVVVGNDADTALVGAFPDSDGAVVLAGTGSIALGRSGTRRTRAGGYGFLLGDEGSGWWIGRQAVRTALAERDAGRQPGALAQAVTGALGTDLDGIITRVYTDPRDRTVLSGLVPTVAALASSDDAAGLVLDQAADALAGLATDLRTALDAPQLPVAYVGGVFGCDRLRERFVGLTGGVAPTHRPEMAAVLLAEAAVR